MHTCSNEKRISPITIMAKSLCLRFFADTDSRLLSVVGQISAKLQNMVFNLKISSKILNCQYCAKVCVFSEKQLLSFVLYRFNYEFLQAAYSYTIVNWSVTSPFGNSYFRLTHYYIYLDFQSYGKLQVINTHSE